ncbi:MAG: hypothetical protein D6753_10140 [Planctomycetota bacterium]|nr:MAG: hypothetical protein D6753_10140 [Planctomycetota bacterium]
MQHKLARRTPLSFLGDTPALRGTVPPCDVPAGTGMSRRYAVRGPARWIRWIVASLLCCWTLVGPPPALAGGQDAGTAPSNASISSEAGEPSAPAGGRAGYLVDVPLPLIGDRDAQVRRQIEQIAQAHAADSPRAVVVLRFASQPIATISGAPADEAVTTRGSQFERCLALARFLTSPEAGRVRLVAYIPQTVEGHAVLPVLACEEIVMASTAELGRAAIDEPADATIIAAYRDLVQRRSSLPEAVVLAMLDPRQEVYRVEQADGAIQFVTREQAEALRETGTVVREETVWAGGGLAAFSGAQMRARGWIAPTVDDPLDLPQAVGVQGNLRSSRQTPRAWKAISVTIDGRLSTGRVNQILRGLEQQIEQESVNLIVLWIDRAEASYRDAARFADYLADLDPQRVHTLAVIRQPLEGSVGLIAAACRECVALPGVTLAADERGRGRMEQRAMQRALDSLASRTGRPLPLLSWLVDADVRVQEFVHQETGRRAVFADWQVQEQLDARSWTPRTTIAGPAPLDAESAVRYRLIDRIEERPELALAALGVDAPPPELPLPWLDAVIQMILSQGWLPRLLLTIGFFALMAELGNPGIGAGGFLAAVCFVGFFWIEALNGNVEMLEVILFLGGLAALAIEIFVIPGFGIFGIGGLIMVLASVVLASQTFIWPTTSEELHEVAVNLFWVACLALGGMIGLVLMQKHIERLPMLRWVVLQPTDSDPARERPAVRDHLLGQIGIATTRLNPSGKAQFGDEIVSVVGSGRMIDEGTPVRVVEVLGNLVIVDSAEDGDVA